MLVVDPTTQRSLVVRQSDEVQTFSSDVLIKPQSAICPSTPSPKQSSELRCPPPLQGIVLFFRQSPVRKNRGRRKCGPPWDLLGNHRSSRSLASKAILRDSRGKEGNLQVRRSSGSNPLIWMAVQPPVRSVVYAVSLTTTSRSTHIALQFHLPFPPHLGEPPRCACRSAFLTSSRADWLIAAEWGSLPSPPPSPPPSPSPRRRSENQFLQFESEFRVADSAVHFHFSPHFHFVVSPPSDAAASSVWAGRVRRARFFAV